MKKILLDDYNNYVGYSRMSNTAKQILILEQLI